MRRLRFPIQIYTGEWEYNRTVEFKWRGWLSAKPSYSNWTQIFESVKITKMKRAKTTPLSLKLLEEVTKECLESTKEMLYGNRSR